MSNGTTERPPHQPMAVAVTLMKEAKASGYDITHLQLQQML